MDFRTRHFLDPASHAAMIKMVVRDKNMNDILYLFPDSPQGGLESQQIFRRIQTCVEQGSLVTMTQEKNMHMLQPEGHGQRNHVKIIHNFFYQGSEPSSRQRLF
jgi:hypothetical protein